MFSISFYNVPYIVIAAGLLVIIILRTIGIPGMDTYLLNIALILLMNMDNPAPGCGISGLYTNLPDKER